MGGIEEQFILLGIGWVFIFVRVFVRWRLVGPRDWDLDDYLMPVVGVSAPSARCSSRVGLQRHLPSGGEGLKWTDSWRPM